MSMQILKKILFDPLNWCDNIKNIHAYVFGTYKKNKEYDADNVVTWDSTIVVICMCHERQDYSSLLSLYSLPADIRSQQ